MAQQTNQTSAEKSATYKGTGFAGFVDSVLKVVTYPAALFVTYLGADVSLRGSLYKNFAQQGYFNGKPRQLGGVQKEYDATFQTIVKDGYKETIANAAEGTAREDAIKRAVKYHVFGKDNKDLETFLKNELKMTAENIKPLLSTTGGLTNLKTALEEKSPPSRFTKLLNQYRFDEVKPFFDDIHMKGLRDFSAATTRNQKAEAVVFAVTAGGVVLGSLLTVANSPGLFDMLSHLHDKKPARQPDPNPTGFTEKIEQQETNSPPTGRTAA